MGALTESIVEAAAIGWLEAIGWRIVHGPDIAFDQLLAERGDYRYVVMERRLREVFLPKLISGELRVKDAERFLEERGL